MPEYEVVWNGAHQWANADLLRPIPPAPRPSDPIIKARPIRPKRDYKRHSRASLEKYCHECGQQFYLRCPSEGVRRGGRRFCSAKCAALSKLLPDHLASADCAHERAQRWFKVEPCEVCGTLTDIHRHHRDGNPWNNCRENIAFLCKPHHKLVHFQSRVVARSNISSSF